MLDLSVDDLLPALPPRYRKRIWFQVLLVRLRTVLNSTPQLFHAIISQHMWPLRRFSYLQLLTVLLIGSSFPLVASPIIYSISGIGSGENFIGGPDFVSAPIEFTLFADTSQQNGAYAQLDLGFVTFGGEVFPLNTTVIGNNPFSPFVVGLETLGNGTLNLFNTTPLNSILHLSSPALDSYSLVDSIGPICVSAVADPEGRIQASLPFGLLTSISDVTFYATTPTPEPVSLALIGLGLFALLFFRGLSSSKRV
jgi:hypothetical protein